MLQARIQLRLRLRMRMRMRLGLRLRLRLFMGLGIGDFYRRLDGMVLDGIGRGGEQSFSCASFPFRFLLFSLPLEGCAFDVTGLGRVRWYEVESLVAVVRWLGYWSDLRGWRVSRGRGRARGRKLEMEMESNENLVQMRHRPRPTPQTQIQTRSDRMGATMDIFEASESESEFE